jgi:hypothetical protein
MCSHCVSPRLRLWLQDLLRDGASLYDATNNHLHAGKKRRVRESYQFNEFSELR